MAHSGIGRAIAHGLAQAGADVIPDIAPRSNRWRSAAGEIEALGRRTLRVTSDVSDRPSLYNGCLREAVSGLSSKVDILVNSAGRTKRAPTIDFSDEDWNAIMDTNLTGTLRACRFLADTCSSESMGASLTSRPLNFRRPLRKWPLIRPARPPLRH